MDKKLIEKLETGFVEELFATPSGHLIQEGDEIPVLISAPHSVSQHREGKIKIGEYKTGVLAELLHRELNCPVIYKTKNMQDDANWDNQSAYKDSLIAYIKKHGIRTVYDLHISSPMRDFDVDLGTGYGENVFDATKVEDVILAFQANGLEDIKVNAVFPASSPSTVSATVARECGIDCIQFEINWRHLDTTTSFEGFEKVYKALRLLIEKESERA